MSSVLAAASPPEPVISSTTSWAGPASAPVPSRAPPRSLTTTLAPCRASDRAYSRPSPRPAPVTMQTRPSHMRSSLMDAMDTTYGMGLLHRPGVRRPVAMGRGVRARGVRTARSHHQGIARPERSGPPGPHPAAAEDREGDGACGRPTSAPISGDPATGRSSWPCSTRSWGAPSAPRSSSDPRRPTRGTARSWPTTAPPS